jgi:hypothetical protein
MDRAELIRVSRDDRAADQALAYLVPRFGRLGWWWRRGVAAVLSYLVPNAVGVVGVVALASPAGLVLFLAGLAVGGGLMILILIHYDREDAEVLVIRQLDKVIVAADSAIAGGGAQGARILLAKRLEAAATGFAVNYGRSPIWRPKSFRRAQRHCARRCGDVIRSYVADAAVGRVEDLVQLRDDMMRAVLRVAPQRWPQVADLRPEIAQPAWHQRILTSGGVQASAKVAVAAIPAVVAAVAKTWTG